MQRNADILVVDDQTDSQILLEDILASHYRVRVVDSGHAALAYLEAGQPADLVLLDVLMPGLDGFETCTRILAMPERGDTPVIMVTGLNAPEDELRGLSSGAADFVHKPVSPPVLLARVDARLELTRARRALAQHNAALEAEVAARTDAIERHSRLLVAQKQALLCAQDATISALCALMEARDAETGNHIHRTSAFVEAIGRYLQQHPRLRRRVTEDDLELMVKTAPLHDIGKIAIPDRILHKPGPLAPDEQAIMRRHCEFGRDALVRAGAEHPGARPFLRVARDIAYSHHEHWDGSGYPEGLAGHDIPLAARIMALADVYDALTTERPYKPAFSHARAVQMINTGRGTHFDPAVVSAFRALGDEIAAIAERLRDPPVPERVSA